MVLLDDKIEYLVDHAFDEELLLDHKPTQWELELYVYKKVLKAQAKKILIQLQTIYNLPDEGMFHKQMGEFIEDLMGEVE